MGYKGLQVLKFLVENGYKDLILDIIYSDDPNVLDDKTNEIITICNNNNIEFHNKSNIPNKKAQYSIAISWRWLIDQKEKLIVLHDSLLPKYRGFAPLVSALKNGEKFFGVTAIFATEKYDEGPIIFQEKMSVQYPIKINAAINLISTAYQTIILKIFNQLSQNETLFSSNQDHSQATYSLWLDDQDYYINWEMNSEYIERHVNAVGYPYLGAKSLINQKKVTILEGKSIEDVPIENRMPGKVIYYEDQYPVVVCGQGLYKITEILNEDGSNTLPLKVFRTRFSSYSQNLIVEIT